MYYLIHSFVNVIGVFLALIRLYEPFVWMNFKKSLTQAWSNLDKNRTSTNSTYSKSSSSTNPIKFVAFSNQSLYCFLNSALNIEYVYLILQGISLLNEDKEIEHIRSTVSVVMQNKSSERKVLKLSELKIKNKK